MSELPVRRDADDPIATSTADVGTADAHTRPVVDSTLDDDADSAYDAVVVTYDDAPDECTIFPAEVSEADLVTTWVSASQGSFVALAAMR